MLAVVLGGALLLAGCSSHDALDPFAGKGSPRYTKSGPIPKGGGRRMVGKPYQVAGRTYYPTNRPKKVEVGMASWYGPKFHRRRTSNGEWFDMNYLTAAHKTMPLPSYARVTNLENGRVVVVRVNDRGPFVGTRIIDLSKAAAERLGYLHKGKARVRVEYLGPAPLGDDRHLLARLNRMRTAPKPRLLAAIQGRVAPSVSGRGDVMLASAAPLSPARSGPVAASGTAAYFVQVASFADRTRADDLYRDLARHGPARLMAANVSGMRFWRVQLGPFASAREAEDARRAVRQVGIHDAQVIAVQAAGG